MKFEPQYWRNLAPLITTIIAPISGLYRSLKWLRGYCRSYKQDFSQVAKSTIKHAVKQQIIKQLSCCCLCHEPCQRHNMICDCCLADIAKFKLPLSDNIDLLQWPAIHQTFIKSKFDHLYAVAPYTWPYNLWLPQLKYQGRFDLADLLSFLLFNLTRKHAQLFSTHTVIPVPIHLTKWQQRGYNQAELIAKKYAKLQGLEIKTQLVTRIKATENQVGKTGAQRRRNLKNAFAISNLDNVPEKVLLVDDVVTTGTTCNEISRLLKLAGVKEVSVLSLCIALPEAEQKFTE